MLIIFFKIVYYFLCYDSFVGFFDEMKIKKLILE